MPLLSGEAVPTASKALRGRAVAFPVTVSAKGTQVIYLRAEDRFLVFVWPEWWPEQAAFHEAQTRMLLAEGIYFGGLLALLGYNALLWLRLRLADTGYHVSYPGLFALFMLLARGYPLALGWSLGSPATEMALTVAASLSGFFLTQFARVFLELSRHPRADRVARGLGGLMLALAVGALSSPWWQRPYWLPAASVGTALTHMSLLVLGGGRRSGGG